MIPLNCKTDPRFLWVLRRKTWTQKTSLSRKRRKTWAMMTPSQYKLTTSPTIPSYLPFCHPSRFLILPCHKKPNLVSSFREKPRFGCFASSSPMATPTQSSETKPFSVLFVCLGNICRSPAAEGVFRDIVKKRGLDSKFIIDSAGTIDYHEVWSITLSSREKNQTWFWLCFFWRGIWQIQGWEVLRNGVELR